MDEGYADDVTAVSQAEDVPAQGKDQVLVESRNVLEPRGRVITGEGNLRRSSIQQFVDILGGQDASSSVNIVEIPEGPCSSYQDVGEGRVQDLTLGNYTTGFNTVNEGEMMHTILNEWQHGNQTGLGSEAETTLEDPTHKEKSSRSSALRDSRPANVLGGQGFNHEASSSPGHDDCDAVLQHAFSSGPMRMKILSRSSECPEYFVKDTLKGKGILCRGPTSAGEYKGQNTVKAVAAPMLASNPSVKIGENFVIPSKCANVASSGNKSVNAGTNLREWMRSRQKLLNKVDTLDTFKQILDLVYLLHSDGKVLVDLRPSFFRLLPSKTIQYSGHVCAQKEMLGNVIHKDFHKSHPRKRQLEQGMSPHTYLSAKHQKSIDKANFLKMKSQFQLGYGPRPITNKVDANLAGAGPGDSKTSSRLHLPPSAQQHAVFAEEQQEEKWYRSPEELLGRNCTSSSNIYSLGVFFFELLSSFDSVKMQTTVMSDLRHRILPPNFLSESPKEAGFCLWLLHPEPSLRPTARYCKRLLDAKDYLCVPSLQLLS